MSGLSFLKNVSLQSNSAVKTPVSRTASAQAKNPTNADIRIFKNGAVYPSAKLVEQCNLQYAKKDAEDKGNGFDVFTSTDFLNTKHWPADQKCMFIAMVPKDAGKVDLFSATSYEADGAPKSDVLTQGAVTAGLSILEMIEKTYGISIGERNFIDLKILSDSPFTTDDNIYFVPKIVSRGEKKGEVTLTRREDLTLYPIAPIELLEGGSDGGNSATGKDESAANQEKPEAKEEQPEAKKEPSTPLSEVDPEETDIPSEAAPLPDDVKEALLPEAEEEEFNLDQDDDTLSV